MSSEDDDGDDVISGDNDGYDVYNGDGDEIDEDSDHSEGDDANILENLNSNSLVDDGPKTPKTPKLTTPDYQYQKLDSIGPPPSPFGKKLDHGGGKSPFSPSTTGRSTVAVAMNFVRPAESVSYEMSVGSSVGMKEEPTDNSYVNSMLKYQSLAEKIFKKPGRRERVAKATRKAPPSAYTLKLKADAAVTAAAAAESSSSAKRKSKRKGTTICRLGNNVLGTASLVDDDNDEFILRKLAEATITNAQSSEPATSTLLQMKPQRPKSLRASKAASPRPTASHAVVSPRPATRSTTAQSPRATSTNAGRPRPPSSSSDRPMFLSMEPPKSVISVPFSTGRTGSAGSPPSTSSVHYRSGSPKQTTPGTRVRPPSPEALKRVPNGSADRAALWTPRSVSPKRVYRSAVRQKE